jgi:hypothetical protein
MSLKRKLPRKFKQFEKEICDALTAAKVLAKERHFGEVVPADDPSPLARDRDSYIVLGILHALIYRGEERTPNMRQLKLSVYKQIYKDLEQNYANHPTELFVCAYLYTHVGLNLISTAKFTQMITQFSDIYGKALGWDDEDYTPEA